MKNRYPISLTALMERDGGKCHYCALPIQRKHAVKVHLKPNCTTIAEVNANVVLAHQSCSFAGAPRPPAIGWHAYQFAPRLCFSDRQRFLKRQRLAKAVRRSELNLPPS